MASELPQDSMDIDRPGVSKDSPRGPEEDGIEGTGLPYAPEDFPNPGDKWGWKSGKRTTNSGYYRDRYTYVPEHLRKPGHPHSFASRPSLEQYVQKYYPETDIVKFFGSFCWRIPSEKASKGDKLTSISPTEIAEDTGEARCKAGNKSCSSLVAQQEDSFPEVMPCDICCGEPDFCRDCCCILCWRVIDKASDDHSSYIRCQANVDGTTCGHSCHINCALRAYMAGTVGGSIGLDAEYYCRRCDSITDLVSYVTKLVENCKSVASQDKVEKSLRVGVLVLRGSKKTSAVKLLRQIELAMSKLKNGTNLEDIWKDEDVSADNAGQLPNVNDAPGSAKNKELKDCETGAPPTLSPDFDCGVESMLLEDEVNQTLDALRKSQKMEYDLAEGRLSAQKKYIQNLYLRLDRERSDLSRDASSKDRDSLLVDQIKRGLSRLEEMKEVSKGFGKVPKRILNERFGLDVEL